MRPVSELSLLLLGLALLGRGADVHGRQRHENATLEDDTQCDAHNGGAFVAHLRSQELRLCSHVRILPILRPAGRIEGVVVATDARIVRVEVKAGALRKVSIRVEVPCDLRADAVNLPGHMYQEFPWSLAGVGESVAALQQRGRKHSRVKARMRSKQPRNQPAASAPSSRALAVAPSEGQRVKCSKDALLFARDGMANPFHAVAAVAGAFFSATSAGMSPALVDVVVTDSTAEDGDMSIRLLRALFKSVQPLRAGQCAERLVLPSPHLSLPWREFHTPMRLRCTRSALFDQLRAAVALGFGLGRMPHDAVPIVPASTSAAQLGDAPRRQAHALLLLRNRKPYRRLLNPSDVLRVLREGYGVDASSADLGDLTLREQLAAVRRADVLVGVHGAAMTWLLFAQPRTTVVELVPPRSGPFCYYNLAHLANHRACRYRTEEARHTAAMDVYVHPPLFAAFLELCFASEVGISTDPYFSDLDPFPVVPYTELLQGIVKTTGGVGGRAAGTPAQVPDGRTLPSLRSFFQALRGTHRIRR